MGLYAIRTSLTDTKNNSWHLRGVWVICSGWWWSLLPAKAQLNTCTCPGSVCHCPCIKELFPPLYTHIVMQGMLRLCPFLFCLCPFYTLLHAFTCFYKLLHVFSSDASVSVYCDAFTCLVKAEKLPRPRCNACIWFQHPIKANAKWSENNFMDQFFLYNRLNVDMPLSPFPSPNWVRTNSSPHSSIIHSINNH